MEAYGNQPIRRSQSKNSIASSTSPVTRQKSQSKFLKSDILHGWLFKKPTKSTKKTLYKILKPFKKRWFVLKQNIIYYFENDCSPSPLGCIALDEVSITIDDEEEEANVILEEGQSSPTNKRHSHRRTKSSDHMSSYNNKLFPFSVTTPMVTHYLAADSREVREQWIHAISQITGANQVQQSMEVSTKLKLTIQEATLPLSRDVTIIAKSINKEYKTVKKYQTNNPIWNEQVVLEIPKFPFELHLYMVVEHVENKHWCKEKGHLRINIMEPTSKTFKEEGWFVVKKEHSKKQQQQLQQQGMFVVMDLEEAIETGGEVSPVIVTSEEELGKIYISMEYIFEDLEGYPIAYETYLESKKQSHATDFSMRQSRKYTNVMNQIPESFEDIEKQKLFSRKQVVQRRYEQEMLKLQMDRKREMECREMKEKQSQLSQLEENLKKEEEKFKQTVATLKEQEVLEKQQLEEKLRKEQEKITRELLEEERDRIESILLFRRQRNEKLKNMETMMRLREEQQMRNLEQKMKEEEERRLLELEQRLKKQEEEMMNELDRKLKLEEEAKVQKLQSEIAEMESELQQKQEYEQLRELRRKKQEEHLSQDEKQVLHELREKLKNEEITWLIQLHQRVQQEEEERLKQVETELNDFEEQKRKELNMPPPPPPHHYIPPAPSLRIQMIPTDPYSDEPINTASFDEMLKAKIGNLKKVEEKKKKKFKGGFNSSVVMQLMKRRQAMHESDEESEEAEIDEDGYYSDDNPILNVISKKIEKLQQKEIEEDDDW